MCGFVGVISAHRDQKAHERALDLVAHRGPDGAGFHHEDWVVVGHRRLAVLGLGEQGHQPMHSRSGRFVLVFNGEIYNHKALRKLVDEVGSGLFRGSSDSESFIEAIDAFGLHETLVQTRGMFSFALIDRSRRLVHLVRDRFGEKPLYFARGRGNAFSLAFASEPQALFELGVDRSLERDAVASLVLGRSLPSTPFAAVSVVEPGTIVTIDASGSITVDVYWSARERFKRIARSKDQVSHLDLQEEFGQVLTESVREQLAADVPLGAFLSGGVDSSLVVAIMGDLLPSSFKTFTVGFPDQKRNEAPFALEVARRLSTEHHELIVTDADVLRLTVEAIQSAREPFVDPSMVPTLALCRFARQHVTVALTGDGGDELFFGYAPWVRELLRLKDASEVTAAREPLSSRELVIRTKLGKARRFSKQLFRRAVPAQHEVLRNPAPPLGGPIAVGDAALWAADTMQDGMESLAAGILQKVDRAAMSVSLETRAPFLGVSVAEFAMAIPVEINTLDRHGKFIVREQLKKYLPADLVDRPKKGFTPPLGPWFKGPLREMVGDILSPVALEKSEFFRPREVNALVTEFFRGGVSASRIWPIFAVEGWLQLSKRAGVAHHISRH